MRTRIIVGLSLVAVAGVVWLMWPADPSQEVASTLAQAAQPLTEEPRIPEVHPNDARQLIRNLEILERLNAHGDVAKSGESLRKLREDKFLGQLIERARGVVAKDPPTAPAGTILAIDAEIDSPAVSSPEAPVETAKKLSSQERSRIATEAEGAIRELGRKYSLAALDTSLLRLMDAKAAFGVLHKDLEASGANGLPSEHLSLAPTQELQKAVTGLRTLRGWFADQVAIGNWPETQTTLEFVDSEIKQLQTILDSPGHHSFQKSKYETFKTVSKKLWKTLSADRSDRVTVQMQKSQEDLQFVTGWKELAQAKEFTRGPPLGSVDAIFLESIQSLNTDPAGALRALSRIEGLNDHLRDVPELVSSETTGFLREALIPQLLSDQTLRESLRQILTILPEGETPQSLLFSDQYDYLRRTLQVVQIEQQRRAGGGQQVNPTESLSQLVDFYVKGTLPRRAQAHLLALAVARFPRRDLIPHGVREEIRSIRAETVAEYSNRLATAAINFLELSDLFAQSTAAVDQETLKEHQLGRDHLQAAYSEFKRYAEESKTSQVDVEASLKRISLLAALFPVGPPGSNERFDPPDPLPTGGKLPPFPSSGGGGAGALFVTEADLRDISENITRTNPRLNKSLFYIEAYLEKSQQLVAEVSRAAAELDRSAPLYATQLGRRVLPEKLIVSSGARPDVKALPVDREQTRLPESHAKWKGRLNGDQPFDFQAEVKNPRTFKAVGGGVHFGEVARPLGDKPFANCILRYTSQAKLHFVDISDPATPQIIKIENSPNPVSLKAMYRFAKAGRNAAISIGWGVERPSLLERLTQSRNSTVLLDPYFVDTPLGLDLILADKIPWDFEEEKLPNGAPVTFHVKFKEEYDAFRDSRIRILEEVVRNVNSFADTDRSAWASRLERSKSHPALIAVVREASLKEAREGIAAQARRDAVEELGGSLAVLEPDQELRRCIEKIILKNSNVENRDDLTFAGELELDAQVNKVVSEINSDAMNRFDALLALVSEPEQRPINLLLQLTNLFMLEQFSEGTCPRAVVDLWVALVLADSGGDPPSRRDIAESLLASMDSTTLAMLYDDEVTIDRKGGTAVVNATMKYRYATSRVHIDDTSVLTVSRDVSISEVETIQSLTTLVNHHVSDLAAAYPPLKRVIHDAEITALLKWAISAREHGELMGIDFSELAAIPAHDPENSPTPDAISRGER